MQDTATGPFIPNPRGRGMKGNCSRWGRLAVCSASREAAPGRAAYCARGRRQSPLVRPTVRAQREGAKSRANRRPKKNLVQFSRQFDVQWDEDLRPDGFIPAFI